LGATLFCLLTGRPPFPDPREVSLGELLKQVQRGDFVPPRRVQPGVPAALEAICLKAMALDPAQRYASPRELASDVERWLADEAVTAHRESWPERLGRWTRRHRAWAQAGAAALLLTAIVAVTAAVVVDHARREEKRAHAEADEQRDAAVEARKKAG